MEDDGDFRCGVCWRVSNFDPNWSGFIINFGVFELSFRFKFRDDGIMWKRINTCPSLIICNAGENGMGWGEAEEEFSIDGDDFKCFFFSCWYLFDIGEILTDNFDIFNDVVINVNDLHGDDKDGPVIRLDTDEQGGGEILAEGNDVVEGLDEVIGLLFLVCDGSLWLDYSWDAINVNFDLFDFWVWVDVLVDFELAWL